MIEQIYRYLKKDLDKIEKLQFEHELMKDTQKRVGKSSHRSHSTSIPIKGKEYKGWDFKTCPQCGGAVELLSEECPLCHKSFGKYLAN